MKVALVHELLTMRGGAERVLRVFADMFPDAPIYTLLYDEKMLGDWFPKHRVRPSSIQDRALFSKNHHLYLKDFPRAVEQWDFSEFDLVISLSSAFVHGIITNSRPKHLCYVNSPARYLWDRTHDVLERSGKGFFGPLKRFWLERTFHKLRIWDAEAADRPDRLIAASKTVQRRIELYWRRESAVIYPPIDDFWLTPHSTFHIPHSRSYYLIASTLADYKRLDLAIAACNKLGKKLIIAGDGAARSKLEAMAGPIVEFVGYTTEEKLKDLYTNAKAVLFPGDEDFGLVPLEALACGTPVVAYRSGGALETLKDGMTAEFFDEPTSESLTAALEKFETRTFDPETCRKAAEPFGRKVFEEAMRKEVVELMG